MTIGNGTTSVLLIPADLLYRAVALWWNSQIHPTTINIGDKRALKESIRYIQQNLGISTKNLPVNVFYHITGTSFSSKFSSYFEKDKNKDTCRVGSISVILPHGRSTLDSINVQNGICMLSKKM